MSELTILEQFLDLYHCMALLMLVIVVESKRWYKTVRSGITIVIVECGTRLSGGGPLQYHYGKVAASSDSACTMAEATMSSASSSSSTPGSPASTRESSRSRSSTPFEPAKELLDEYQTLLFSTFDLTGLLPTQPLGDEDEEAGRTMTKAEKQNAKKKRRKEREREAKLAEAGAGSLPSKAETSIGMSLS